MSNPKSDSPKKRFKPTLSTWIVGAIALLFLIVGTTTSGFSGFLIMTGLIALFTAIYTLVSGRKGWVKLPSRKVAVITLVGSIVVMGVGGGIAPPTDAPSSDPAALQTSVVVVSPSHSSKPTPETVKFTEGDPGDPATVVASDGNPSVAIEDNTVTNASAIALLETLPVKGKAPKTGYDRTEMFGTAWLDVDHNGCDTRNDILARDLTSEVRSGACKVLSGVLVDSYTGKTISFLRGNTTSALVQIDHMVALSNAWQTGAQQLTQAQRISLANDPLNLMAINGPTNTQKGDGDAATWLPPAKSFRCTYVARQVSVKATYALWVTQAEHDAMSRILSDCGGQWAITSTFAPAPVVVAPPAPEPVAPPAPAPAPKPAPAPAPAPVAPGGGATALCKDGSLSYAANHQGACSHHGGVAVWYK